jgi:hypothetical protein
MKSVFSVSLLMFLVACSDGFEREYSKEELLDNDEIYFKVKNRCEKLSEPMKEINCQTIDVVERLRRRLDKPW